MLWEDLDRFIDEGGSGPEAMELIEGLRGNAALRRRLQEEVMLASAAASTDSLLVIDRFLLDDFYQGRLPARLRAHVLAALCTDDELWRQLQQIDRMYITAEEYEAESGEPELPDELKEPHAVYKAGGDRVPLAAVGAVTYRWRIEERHPGCRYDIRPRSERRLLGGGGMGLVDEATISRGDVRCAIAFSPRERKLELQIENCPLGPDEFERAEALLCGSNGVGPLRPSRRSHSGRLCLIVFEDVDPLASYELEIDPTLLNC